MRRAIALILLICLFLAACGENTVNSKKKRTSSDTSSVSDVNSQENDGFETTGALSGTVETNMLSEDTKEKPLSVFSDSQSGGYDKSAIALRNSIQNTESHYKISGKTYYISPNGDDFDEGTSPDSAWQSLDALLINNFLLKPGDAVLFERNGVYRANSSIIISTSGITYGAYGKGKKPCIYGSPVNYADADIWESSNKKNIWKMEFPQKDAGIIVFNYGEFSGVKKGGLASMTANGHFYHNTNDKMFYVYCDKGNPGKVWEDIEIGTNQFLMSIYGGVSNITIDNICFKYTGAHGIDAFENNHDIKITNCEFGWIGGSIQGGVTRYGNAIQFWDSCWNIEVRNNWIYQVYDAGITFQYAIESKDGGNYHDITFANNLIEYCTYSIEIFTSRYDGSMKNIHLDSNVMRFSGFGFGNQRPNSVNVSNICGWSVNYGDSVSNFCITNNVFDCSESQLVDWGSGSQPHIGFKIYGNTFYQKRTKNKPVMNFGVDGYSYAVNQSEFNKAVSTFDTAPKKVQWLG